MELALVYIAVFVYALSYQMQAPIVPFLVESMGGDAAEFSSMQSLFSIIQLIGGVLSGRVLDRIGPRALLIVSLLASTISYSMAASATDLLALFLSKVPALLQHGVLSARGIVADRRPESERTILFGYLMLSYGIGSMIGPATGGFLSEWAGMEAVSWTAALLNTAMACAIYIGLPTSKAHKKLQTVQKQSTAAAYRSVLRVPLAQRLLLLRACISLASNLTLSVLPILMKDVFLASPHEIGWFLSARGMMSTAIHSGMLRAIVDRTGEANTIQLSTGLLCGAFTFALLFVRSIQTLFVFSVPLTLGLVLFSTVCTSTLSKSVSKNTIGTALSLEMGIGDCIGIIAPILSLTLLHSSSGCRSIFFASAVCSGAAFLLQLCRSLQTKQKRA